MLNINQKGVKKLVELEENTREIQKMQEKLKSLGDSL